TVFAAGKGNAALAESVGLSSAAMQIRPLHMVMVRSRSHLPTLNGHCVDGSSTRVTITTTRDFSDRVIWQIGGRIAGQVVDTASRDLATLARRELEAVLPGVKFDGLEWATYKADRAEPATRGGARPDDACVERRENVVTAWPVKLALVPEMVRRVTAQV